ncbi:MAG: hypothetical protein HC929_14920 [Leptolyngbyaceae cyanobacterium SM2_5_2]|nr:hypothetical protein [Leptolyngbyaceae cyanobacterium SM2_5_2]
MSGAAPDLSAASWDSTGIHGLAVASRATPTGLVRRWRHYSRDGQPLGRGFRPDEVSALGGDLLNADVFNHQMELLARRMPAKHQKTWRQTQLWARESQDFAGRIYDRDPLLQVELLEAMHTVIDLAQQVADGLAVIDQIETPTYQKLAQQRLAASQTRLQATHAQLQQLQDQIALASLDSPSDNSLPQRLQTLIAANRHILEDTPPI